MKCETNSFVITVYEYKKEDYDQLHALLLSYNYLSPFYVYVNEQKKYVCLVNLRGFLKDDEGEPFDEYEWKNCNLDEIIEKRKTK